jgi:hypothetical protein
MTCDLCSLLYKTPPCKTNEKLTIDNLRGNRNKFEVSSFNLIYYEDLKDHCPCKECLVKTMCTMNQTTKCTQYIDFENFIITKANKGVK